ncbi:MAG: hypothetical protein KH696_10875, partial [Sutterella sp.]|nr:hypothetical protein [Sutterella sp.]
TVGVFQWDHYRGRTSAGKRASLSPHAVGVFRWDRYSGPTRAADLKIAFLKDGNQPPFPLTQNLLSQLVKASPPKSDSLAAVLFLLDWLKRL